MTYSELLCIYLAVTSRLHGGSMKLQGKKISVLSIVLSMLGWLIYGTFGMAIQGGEILVFVLWLFAFILSIVGLLSTRKDKSGYRLVAIVSFFMSSVPLLLIALMPWVTRVLYPN